MAIICVLEYPRDGDQAHVVFADTDRFQPNNPDHQAYKAAIAQAQADENNSGAISISLSVSYGGSTVDECFVDPPCLVSDLVTLYME